MNAADYRPQVITHLGRSRVTVGLERNRLSAYHWHGAVFSEVTAQTTHRCSHEHTSFADAQRCARELVNDLAQQALSALAAV